jgi:hypothetical protein
VSKRSYERLLRRWATASERLSRMKRAAIREGIKLSAMSGYKAAANDLIKADMALDAADGTGETRIHPTWWKGKEWFKEDIMTDLEREAAIVERMLQKARERFPGEDPQLPSGCRSWTDALRYYGGTMFLYYNDKSGSTHVVEEIDWR